MLALNSCVEVNGADTISVERAMQGDCEDLAGKSITDKAGNEVVVVRPDCADDSEVARMSSFQIQTNGTSKVERTLELGEALPAVCTLKSGNGASIAIHTPEGVAYNKYRSSLAGILYVDAGTVIGDALIPACDINKQTPLSA